MLWLKSTSIAALAAHVQRDPDRNPLVTRCDRFERPPRANFGRSKKIGRAIEWTPLGFESDMIMEVRDNTLGETYVLDSGLPFNVTVRWEVPTPVVPTLRGSFRIRVYAESIGPGPEVQIGPTTTVPVGVPAAA